MSTLLVDQDIHMHDNVRSTIIKGLRQALNAAEGGQDEITILQGNMEITWNLADGEFFVIG